MAASLLSGFPSTSNAYSLFKSSEALESEYSGPPPRKTPRLNESTHASAKGKGRAGDSGVQRIRIQFRSVPINPQSHLNSSKQVILHTVRAILTLPSNDPGNAAPPIPLPATFEDVSSAVRNIISIGKKGDNLYTSLEMEIDKAVTIMAQELSRNVMRRDLSWLDQFVMLMEWFEKRVHLLRSIFADLDYGYVLHNASLKPIRDLCFEKVCNTVVNHPECTSRIIKGVEEWVATERNSSPKTLDEDVEMQDVKAINPRRDAVRRLTKFLTTVSLYDSHLFEPYLNSTMSYYDAESQALATKLSPARYFVHCATRLKEEEERVLDTLHENSLAPVLNAAETRLLSKVILQTHTKAATAVLIKERDVPGLAGLYSLHQRVNEIDILTVAFRNEVQTTIQKIVTDINNDDSMITSLLQEKAFLDRALVEAFHERPFTNTATAGADSGDNDRPFANAARTAFERGFSARKRKPAEMIAKYIDTAMRKGQREESDDDFWKELDAVLGLYRFTPDKDVFRTFYERALARRLLLSKSASDDIEKKVIHRLKEGYDPEFGKGDEKFKDLALSKDFMEEYKLQLARSEGGAKMKEMTMSAIVLQYSSWPFKTWKGQVRLPTEMQNSLADFETFYKNKHQRHSLEWNHGLGTAILTAKFDDGEGNGTEIKELSVSLLQCVVLLLFNEEDEWTFSSIHERTGIENKDLAYTLQSLACGKFRVLAKKPPGKDVVESDSFIFNSKFKNPKRKIHIPSIQQREVVEEQRDTEKTIDQDRIAFVDAAIVRIMKSAKKLHHEELKAKTIDALKAHFVPSVADIKKQIEKLVEKDYLERDPKDKGVFHYVA